MKPPKLIDQIIPLDRQQWQGHRLAFHCVHAYYDCLILASALESGCEILFSEDMANQQIIENRLKIVNLFC